MHTVAGQLTHSGVIAIQHGLALFGRETASLRQVAEAGDWPGPDPGAGLAGAMV